MSSIIFSEDCRTLIQKVDESWNSYFTKWESIAKYEDDLSENELGEALFNKEKPRKKNKTKQLPHRTSRSVPVCTHKTNGKKFVKKKKCLLSNKTITKSTEKNQDSNPENVRNTQNEELETILKSVLFKFSKETKSEVNIFATFSQILPNTVATDSYKFSHISYNFCNDSHLHSKNSLFFKDNPLNKSLTIDKSGVCPKTLVSYSQKVNKNFNPFEGFPKSNELSQTFFNHRFFDFNSQNNMSLNEYLLTNSCTQSLHQRAQKILYKSTSPALLSSNESSKLRTLEWDLTHKSLASTSRKINKEYFIKRAFPKINIFQYGKRLGNLYSHKRTNSVSLSLENSNLVTPERKPPERKCFSENVLKRKRKHPSKLFFDEVVEDSESDDQNENSSPVISCKNKKPKNPIIKELEEYDSNESIFDRVKKL